MLGLLVEAQQLMQRSKKSAVLDAALACALRKIESYEVVSYDSLIRWAKLVREKDAVKLLAATLEEEEESLKRWTDLALLCDERAANEVPDPGTSGAGTVKSQPKKAVAAFGGSASAAWRF
jgi:ferritin-like metal-binding protein YciE